MVTPKKSSVKKGSPKLNSSVKKDKLNLLEKKRGDWHLD